uniref:ZP domain-containing protein n=1 Tax=Scleropages formosus TaxID=113540 RepID=A0A8C9RZG8_SCLFO
MYSLYESTTACLELTTAAKSPRISPRSPAMPFVNLTFSSWSPTVSSWNRTDSSGNPAVSSGNPTFSSGNPTVSSGSPAVSSGNPAVTSKSSNSVSLVRDPSHSGAVTVECKANEIFVTVAREFLRIRSIAESSLYLGRPDCGVTYGNESHVQLNATWEKCNTQFNSTHSTAQVILFSNLTSGLIMTSPKVYLEIPIMCTYGRNILISTGLTPIGIDMIKDIVEGSGTFHVSFQLLNGTFPLPQNHTLSPNEEVVIEIGINTTVPQLKLITKRCWATPSSNPLDTTSYEFLKNGCPVTGTFTTVLQNGNSSRSRLSVRIFSVVEEIVIYLHCQIQICVETTADICKSVSLSTFLHYITLTHIFHSITICGPLGHTASFQDVGLIILGLALVLLTILVALAVIFYYRSRIGHYNFSFKQKQEKFTYHIFDT